VPPKILLDANLLILLAVGLTTPRLVATHKRTRSGFDETDFKLLTEVLSRSRGVMACPKVFTEASNRLRQDKGADGRRIATTLAALSQKFEEAYVPSRTATTRAEYIALGVTDAVLLELADTGVQLLTTDFDLWGAAVAAGRDARNFNHMRGRRPDFRL
jgi:hypothetical protein